MRFKPRKTKHATSTGSPFHTFYVWKRDDGYVGCDKDRMPQSTSGVSYEQLLATEDPGEAMRLVRSERNKSTHPK